MMLKTMGSCLCAFFLLGLASGSARAELTIIQDGQSQPTLVRADVEDAIKVGVLNAETKLQFPVTNQTASVGLACFVRHALKSNNFGGPALLISSYESGLLNPKIDHLPRASAQSFFARLHPPRSSSIAGTYRPLLDLSNLPGAPSAFDDPRMWQTISASYENRLRTSSRVDEAALAAQQARTETRVGCFRFATMRREKLLYDFQAMSKLSYISVDTTFSVLVGDKLQTYRFWQGHD